MRLIYLNFSVIGHPDNRTPLKGGVHVCPGFVTGRVRTLSGLCYYVQSGIGINSSAIVVLIWVNEGNNRCVVVNTFQ